MVDDSFIFVLLNIYVLAYMYAYCFFLTQFAN